MASVLRDLEAIREANLKLLAAPDDDIAKIQEWGAAREMIFARLGKGDFPLHIAERGAATSLMEEIVGLDAAILARLQQNLATLSQNRTAAVKIQQALGSSAHFYPAVLLQRVA